jgi:hypothetical protein
MADYDDPSLSVGPPSEAKTAPPAAAGEDPLAELARMMSDRSVFDPAPAIRSSTVPIPKAVSPSVALANDLEAKLHDDLEVLLSAFFSHPPPAPVAPPEEPETAAPKPAAAAPPAESQPDAPPAPTPSAPPEEPVTAAPKPAAAAQPQPAASPAPAPFAPPEEAVPADPPPAPVAPPEEPVTAAPKAAELQPAASPAVAPVARALAAALVALEEKRAPRRERSAVSVPSRSGEQASAVSLPRANYQAPRESPADRPLFVRQVTNASGQAAKEKPELARASPLQLTTAAPPAGTGTAIAGHDREHRAVKSPAVAREPSRFASTARRVALSPPKAAQPEEDESPKVGPFGGSTPVEGKPFRRRTGTLVHYIEDGEPPPRSHEIEELSYRRPRRSLFVGEHCSPSCLLPA